MKQASVWIYKNAKGEIYTVRVVDGNKLDEIPVSNTDEKKLRKLMEQIYGNCIFTVVEILP